MDRASFDPPASSRRAAKAEVFAVCGTGASDALLDWLRAARVAVTVHDIRDLHQLAAAIAQGVTRFPTLRHGEGAMVQGFDARALDRLFGGGEDVGCGLSVKVDGYGQLVVTRVLPGSAGEAAGLRPDDVVLHATGGCLFSVEQLRRALSCGHHDRLLVRRSGRLLSLTLPERVVGCGSKPDGGW